METARVDLRKLQLLNDRIAQVIDALNQVRFSVHGLQHSPGFTGIPGIGNGYTPWQFSPYGQATPFTTANIPGQVPVMNSVTGLSHTAADLAGLPIQSVDPIVAQQMAARFGQAVPVGSVYPYAQAVQYAQTFPWAYVPVAPV
jgi:hypothetical protein